MTAKHQTTGVGINTGPGGVDSTSDFGPGEPLTVVLASAAVDAVVKEDAGEVEEEEHLTRSAISLRQMGQRSSWMAQTSQKPLKNIC